MSLSDAAQVETFLVRDRDFLAIYGNFSVIYHDLDLHILSQGLPYDPFTRQVLADGLGALGLHLASRPIDEYVGWTVHIREPLMNLFFTGDSRSGALTGRAFIDREDVEAREENLFFCQAKREFGEPQLSSISFDGFDMFGVVEQYYRQSEQKLARFFHRESDIAFLLALPAADEEWFEKLTVEEVFGLPLEARVEHLSTRGYRFRCGCDIEKVTGVLVGAYGSAPEILFEGQDRVDVECPRCAAVIRVSRADYDRRYQRESRAR